MKNSFIWCMKSIVITNNQRLKFLEVLEFCLCEVLSMKNDGYGVVRLSGGESDL